MTRDANDARALCDRLLDTCSDYEKTSIVALALVQALMVVLACAAPTPADAKRVLKETLEHIEPGIEAAWAKYRARDN